MSAPVDPFALNVAELEQLLDPSAPLFPELEHARSQRGELAIAAHAQHVLAASEALLDTLAQIPQTTYSAYRAFQRTGERQPYQDPYFAKREYLAAAVVRLFLGLAPDLPLKTIVQDLLWSICEETTWVVPAHEPQMIDLFAAETGFILAETLLVLGDQLDAEVRQRVRHEVERRICKPYIHYHQMQWWYRGKNNWNGVCNSAVAATFLLLDPEPGRVAQALHAALAGLAVFLEHAFEADGGSTEGVMYWHYGLFNLVALAELLFARTRGRFDLLRSQRMRTIAAYPATQQLTGDRFASFSDSDEPATFHFGVIARLAQRTRTPTLLNLLAHPATLGSDWRLTMLLRDLLWWDGTQPSLATLDDAVLPTSGIVRFVAQTSSGLPVITLIKAGHNDENHNHNDVGSWIVNIGGETLLTDPGRGLYSREYFSEGRYNNPFASSYGHSVPLIAGQLQATGRAYAGYIARTDTQSEIKRVEIDITQAYALSELLLARRELRVVAEGEAAGTLWLTDQFLLRGTPGVVEEAFVTWKAVILDGATALIQGEQHSLRLIIEQPSEAQFELEVLEQASRENAKTETLQRLRVQLPLTESPRFRMRIEIAATGDHHG
jgi:hypothetical protein